MPKVLVCSDDGDMRYPGVLLFTLMTPSWAPWLRLVGIVILVLIIRIFVRVYGI